MSSIIRVLSIQESFECAVVGFRDLSEENGRGLRSTYVGRGDLSTVSNIHDILNSATYLRGDESRDHVCCVLVWMGWVMLRRRRPSR